VRLRSSKRPGAVGRKHGSKAFAGDLMQFRVAASAPVDETTDHEHGAELRALPEWALQAQAAADALTGNPATSHTWRIDIGSGLKPTWLINGRTFQPAYADAQAELGEVVTWRLKNGTAIGHLLHLHHTDFLMLKRNGKRPPEYERCLKDTFFLNPFDEVVVAGRISDHPGKYVVHCHMLDHEDHGLMSQFEVVDPAP
jgi:hypothetical protein